MRADENDWKVSVRLGQPPLEFRPALSRQPDVQHNTSGRIRARVIEEFLRRSERLHIVTDRTKQIIHGLAYRFVIVDDIYNRLLLSHRCDRTLPNACAAGRQDERTRPFESRRASW